MTERVVTMTIYKVEAHLLEVTSPASQRQEFVPGYVSVSAQGAGEFHTWQISHTERCWIGDTVEVTVIEPDRDPIGSTPLNVPPLDKR